MVIGTLALLWYFVLVAGMGAGQRLRREPEETKSCKRGGICTYIHPYVSPPPRGPSEADPGLAEADPGLSEAIPGLTEAGHELGGPALRGLGQPLRALG